MLFWVIALANTVFVNFSYFEKRYIHKHTNSHPRKSYFGPRISCFGPPGFRDPPVGNRWSKQQATCPYLKLIDRFSVSFSNVHNVNIVSNGWSICCWVVLSKNIYDITFAHSNLYKNVCDITLAHSNLCTKTNKQVLIQWSNQNTKLQRQPSGYG